jgi:tetratricopeptide (TPR) repeat protein
MSLREGNRLYGKERYEDALERYDRARRSKPKDPRPAFNAGDALYRLSRLDDAGELFGALAARADLPPATRAQAWYNLGNARFDGGDYPAAADAYRRALTLAPRDPDARRNLAVALRAIKNPPPKRQGPKNQPDPKPDPKSEDKKDGGGQGQGDGKTPPPKTRPQDQLTREEAERVLNASEDAEKDARRKAAQAAARRAGDPPKGEDW